MKTIKNIFYNYTESRLRAGARISLFFVIVIIIALIFNLSLHALFPNSKFNDNAPLLFVFSLSIFQIITVVTGLIITGKFIDKQNISEFGFNFTSTWWKDFLFGLLLGAILMTIIFIIQLSLGWITISGFFISTKNEICFVFPLAVCLFHFITVGITEEIMFRGYFIKNLSAGLTSEKNRKENAVIQTLLLTSIFFGFAHAWNPEASAISTINIMNAGIMLGIGYVMTGELAIPIGIHISWNFFQGNVFGFAVSGQSNTTSLAAVIQVQQKGPDFWTGGKFGPEAGMIGFIIITAGILAIYYWVKFTNKNNAC